MQERYFCQLIVASSPRQEDREKRSELGERTGRIFETEPSLKVSENNTVCLELVVLLRVSSGVKTVHGGHLLVCIAMIFYYYFC